MGSPCTTAGPPPPAAPCTTVAPAAPCTTVAPPTCTTFQCPAGWVERPQAYNLQGTLSAELCCLHPTTTPCTTSTHLSCSSFTCPPAPWTKVPGDPVCAATGCTKELCCARLATTPAPASPCTTHAMRLYSAGEEGVVQKSLAVQQNSATSKVSFSMVLPMFALFSVGGVAVAVVIRKAARGRTTHVRLVEPPADEDLFSAGSDAEMLLH